MYRICSADRTNSIEKYVTSRKYAKLKIRGTAMEEEYWAKFRSTGSVTDYLSYRNAVKQENKEQQKTQGDAYDGKHYGDRDNTVGTTHRGV